jgi:signal transduction histidine kinase
MTHTVDHASRFRDASLRLALRGMTGLFGVGALIGIGPLASGTEPMAFFAPLFVFVCSALAWWRYRAGDRRQARWILTVVSVLYVGSLAFAPKLIVLAVGFPLAFLLLLLLHLIHRSAMAKKVGWVTVGTVAFGCVRLLATADWATEWPLATGTVAQVGTVALANGVLGRLARGWEEALAKLEDAKQRLAMNYEVAVDASQAKSRFLASMSHELRTPLNAILGYAELMEDDVADGILPEADDLGRIQKAGRHLLMLVNQVLDLSRVEAGHVDLVLEPIDLAELAAEVVDHVRPQARAKHTELRLDLDDSVGEVRLDALRIRQVLTNLVANAVKFTDAGTVTVSLVEGIDDVQLLVRDTGLGIAAAQLGKIFEPFQQADETVQRTHGGTGLGLAISRRLVTEMGGELSVCSEEGVGSTFTISFPKHRRVQQAS